MLMSSYAISRKRRASRATQVSKTRFRACLSLKSSWTTTRASQCKNWRFLSSKLSRKSKRKRPSWRLELKGSVPSAKRWLTLKRSTTIKRRSTTLLLTKWSRRRNRSPKTWGRCSKSTRRASQSSIQITCRLTFSKRSRNEFSVRPNISPTLINASCPTSRPTTSTSRSSKSSKRRRCVNCEKLSAT